jgi:peroxiredoxin
MLKMKTRSRSWLVPLLASLVLLGSSAFPARAQSPKAGDPAPDFQLQDMKGESVRLSSFRGKPVVLHFWATWCPHCLSEMPLLQEANRELCAGGTRVLAVNLGEPRRKVERYAQEHHLDLTILLDARGKAAQAFGVIGLPATVIVDAQGRIQAQIDMGSLTRDSLEKLLTSKGKPVETP